jgi:3-oxoadipate enol-lactonase
MNLFSRRARFAPSGEVPVAYEVRTRFRSRQPWLVLVQGLGFDRSGWDPVARQLGRRFRLVLVDNRGIGASEVPPGPYTVAAMAGDLVGVLDAAGIRRPLPPSACWRKPAVSPEVALRRHVENALALDTIEQRPQLVERIIAHQRSRLPNRDGWVAQASAGARWAGRGRQRHIRAATLVVQGTADRVADPRNAELLAQLIPQARLEILPGAGHLLFWEYPGRFVELVTSFLDAGAAGRSA